MRRSVLLSLALVLLIAFTASPLVAQDWAKATLEKSPRHREYVAIHHGDRTVQAFVVYPEVSQKAPVVLMIHEIFGLSDWAKEMADELAAQGFIVIAPDLLSGLGPNGGGPNGGGTDAFPGQDAVTKAVSALDPAVVTADLDAAADYGKRLPSANGKLFVAGFCWGGGKSFDFATHRRDLAAAFVFYGPPPTDVTAINAPVYGFYAGNDARITASVPAATAAMKAAGKKYEPVIYDGAGHGFMRAGEDPAPPASTTPAMAAANKTARTEGFKRLVALLNQENAATGQTPAPSAAPGAGQRPPMAAIGVPVAGMPFVHDPSTVVRFHGKYYVFSTGRGTPFYSSPDTLTWTREGSVFAQIPDAVHAVVPKNNGTDAWAPDIIRLGNQFYLYYAVSSWGSFQSAIGLATNPVLDPKDPAYKWTDRGVVITSDGTEDLNAIDPGAILAPDGTLWICYGSYHGSIRVTQLDPKTGLALAPSTLGAPIATARGSEASDIISHDGFFYLFVNHGSCCKGKDSTYNIRVGRARVITGPYMDRDGKPMSEGGGTLFLASDAQRIGPGHFGHVVDYDAPSTGLERFSIHYEADLTRGGRSVLDIRPLSWGADGWPIAGEGKAIPVAGDAQTKLSNYEGQYAVHLGTRTFLALKLSSQDGHLTGSLSQPKGFEGSLFIAVTNPTVKESSVVKAEVRDGSLHFTVQNPSDKSDTDDFQLRLNGEKGAELSPEIPGLASEPYHLERVTAAAVSTDWQPGRAYSANDSDVDNPEMKSIYAEDQKVRQGLNVLNVSKEDWTKMGRNDADRRSRVKQMRADGALHTGKDFNRAAFIFQHGDTPDDCLLAHTLARVAVTRGNTASIWIASATLDRYLNTIGKPQIYGTQFHGSNGIMTTQEPYDRALISDTLRNSLDVPSQETQEHQLELYRKANTKQ